MVHILSNVLQDNDKQTQGNRGPCSQITDQQQEGAIDSFHYLLPTLNLMLLYNHICSMLLDKFAIENTRELSVEKVDKSRMVKGGLAVVQEDQGIRMIAFTKTERWLIFARRLIGTSLRKNSDNLSWAMFLEVEKGRQHRLIDKN